MSDYNGPLCGYAMYGEPAICTCGKCETKETPAMADDTPIKCVMDYPTAWAFIREKHPDPKEHDPRCSWVQASGGILCDCHVINDEYARRKTAMIKGEETPAMADDTVKRYDLITNYRCGSAIEEMERSDDGEWVRYEDIEWLRAENAQLVKAVHVALAHGDRTRLGTVRPALADAVNRLVP